MKSDNITGVILHADVLSPRLKAHLHLALFLRDIARRDILPPVVAFTLGGIRAVNRERYANFIFIYY